MTDWENKILYIDMDGVLAKWENASFQDVSSKGFFLSREPEQNLINAVRLLVESDVEVHILSSVLDNKYALGEKKEWLKRWLPWLPEMSCHFIPYGSAKTPMDMKKTGYLLDDYTRNLTQWIGVGIKCCTDCNDSHGTWDGHRIYASDPAEEIATKLIMIMKMN